jgi:predicted dithiol-disulfide oxidoreductase (DUF899 family)
MSTHKQALSQLDSSSKWRGAHNVLAVATQPPSLHQPLSYEGPSGPVELVELMEDRSQLLLYHFKLATSAHDAPSAGCPGCTRYIDNIDRVALKHLAARDTAFALVSRAPIDTLSAYKNRMSWRHTWVSTTPDNTENHGISIFTRDGNKIYRKYVAIARGTENIGPIWTFLDLPMSGPQQH